MTFPALLVGFALFHALHEGRFMLLPSCTPNPEGAGMLPPSPAPSGSSTVRVPQAWGGSALVQDAGLPPPAGQSSRTKP